MALTQKLEFRPSQALVMTPQLMQAIKLLQLSNRDLAAYVEGELERNPLLERAEQEAEPAEANPQPAEVEPAPGAGASAGDWLGEDLATSRTAIENQLGTRLDNIFPEDAGEARDRAADAGPAGYFQLARVGGGGREDPDYNIQALVSAE